MLKNIVLAAFLIVGVFLVYKLGGVSQSNVLGVSTSSSTSSAALTDGQVVWCINPVNNKQKCYAPISFKAGETALDTFKALVNREGNITYATRDFDAGSSILTINGITMHTNDNNSIYWHFRVNSVPTNAPVSSIVAKDHDHYDLIYSIN